MSRHISFASTLIAICLCATSISQAQEEKVQLQFVSFPKAENPEPLQLVIADGKTIEIETPTNRLSRAYEVSGLKEWTIGKSVAKDDQKTELQILAKAPALNAKKQIILIIRKGAEGQIELKTIDGSGSEFGGGKCFIMNASKVDIGGVIGGKKFLTKPDNYVIIQPDASNLDAGHQSSNTYIFFRKEDKPEPFFTSTWRLSDKARNLVFVYHESDENRLRLHIIRDYLKD